MSAPRRYTRGMRWTVLSLLLLLPVAVPAQPHPAAAVLLPFGAPDTFGYPVSQPFGEVSVDGTHAGVDVAAPCGVPVVAVADGVVVGAVAGRRGDGERSVIVRHTVGQRSFHAYYGHLRGVAVRGGQAVQVGQRLGTVGASGRASGCHLHLAIGPVERITQGYVDGDPRALGLHDPEAFLRDLRASAPPTMAPGPGGGPGGGSGPAQSSTTQQPPSAASPRPHIR